MAIGPVCDKCGEEFDEYGALAFSNPKTLPDGTRGRDVEKYHLCIKCWVLFKEWLKEF